MGSLKKTQNKMAIEKANKILSENSIYVTGVGTVIPTTQANQAVITSYNEGIDMCINELELNGENTGLVFILKKLKLETENK